MWPPFLIILFYTGVIFLQHEVLIPTYMKTFNCIGSACEDSCCVGWKVTLDKDTYKKYKNIKEPVLTAKLKNSMKRNKDVEARDNYYASFVMGEKGRCPMLEESGLCAIQASVGEEMLSRTCSTYPRVINKVGDSLEMSAKLSCPEIARLALLNSEGIDFEYTNIAFKNNWGQMGWMNTSESANGEYLFWDLRMFAIEILQNRNLHLNDRMILLGLIIDKVQQAIDRNDYDDIPSIIKAYKNKMQDESFTSSLSRIQVNHELQLKLIIEIIEKRNAVGGEIPRYMECYHEMLQGLNIQGEMIELNDLVKSYELNHKSYYTPFMMQQGYILENYLVNYVYETLFPNVKGNIFTQFARMSILYSLLRIHLVGVSGFYKGLSSEIVIKIIQSYTRVFEHNASFMNMISELFRQNKLESLPHIVTLLKE